MRGGGLRRLGDCVAVAFEDLFGGDVCGGSVEEGGIVEDRLEVFGDLWNEVSKVSERKRMGENNIPRTSGHCIQGGSGRLQWLGNNFLR